MYSRYINATIHDLSDLTDPESKKKILDIYKNEDVLHPPPAALLELKLQKKAGLSSISISPAVAAATATDPATMENEEGSLSTHATWHDDSPPLPYVF